MAAPFPSALATRPGRKAPASAAPAAILVAVAFLALALPAAAAESPRPSVETEATAAEGLAGLSVRAFASDTGEELKGAFGGAELSVNGAVVGRTPYSDARIPPGTYLLRVEAEGYYPSEILLGLAEKTLYKLVFHLARMTGYLAVEVSPPDAEILVDGKSRRPGLIELPTGGRRLVVRRFGYAEREYALSIEDRATSFLRVELEKAPFAVSELRSSRAAFNPRNAGLLGRCALDFEVSSYGSGRLSILGPSGDAVAAAAFPSFETWRQGFVWRGRGADGLPLPDGAYLARLEAWPAAPEGAAGSAAPPLVREVAIGLDSRIVVEPRAVQAASAGLLYFPDPRALPAGSLALELSASGGADFRTPPAFGLGASYSLGRAGLALALTAEPGESGGEAGAEAALSLSFALVREPGPFAAALHLRGSWSSAVAPIMAGAYPGGLAELALPAALSLGAFRLGLAPGISAAIAADGSEAAPRPFLRAGAWLSGSRFLAGLSGELATGGLGKSPLEPDWPARLALEGRLVLDPSPLLVGGGLFLDLEPGADPALRLGLALGLLL